jgi:SAM-dependent methyltransferase
MFAHYDLFYRDKDYAAEARYLRHFLRGRTVLDLGCGSGKHGLHLKEFGFEVSGIERERELAARCPFPIVASDITAFSLERKFDSIVSLFHVINYLTSKEDLTRMFSCVREHLSPEGIFAFEVWHAPAVKYLGAVTRIKRAGDITRVAIPRTRSDGCIEVHYRFSDEAKTYEVHTLRPFDEEDLPKGFKWVGQEEFLTGHPASRESWSVLYRLARD